MRNRRKFLLCLALTLAVSGMISGCKKEPEETEAPTEAVTEQTTEEETETEKKKTAKSTTYKTKDGNLSIKFPDDTWEVTKEEENQWVFESAEEGVITIVHYTGDAMTGLVFPGSEEEVLNNLEAAGKKKEDYAVVEYKKNMLGSYEAYHTTIKCKSQESKYAYSVAYNLVGEEDIYSVTGQVKRDDAEAMESIRDAVESLKLLNTSAYTEGGGSDSKKETDADQQQSQSDSEDENNGQYVYDSNGNAVYIYQDANGNWVDDYGNTYYFSETGITNSSGQSFTYTKPKNPETNPPTETNSFYDNEGNLITVYKNSNGNWVDSNGIIYTFGQYGVTDNYGNYYPYNGGGNTGGDSNGGNTGNTGGNSGGNTGGNTGTTNGFYDDLGNYITVYQDANGNWVDSAGMEYTFGNDGVTDSYGNFYPY